MKYIIVLIISIAAISYVYLTRKATSDTFTSDQNLSYTLPKFSLTTLSDEIVSSEKFTTGSIVVHFWASWCGPCMEELDELKRFAQAVPDVRFHLIAVNDQKETVLKLLKRFNFPSNCEVYLDKGSVAAEKMGTFKLPESYIVKSGKVARRLQGPQKWTEISAFKSLLNLKSN